jgi:hypothetical protein
MNESGFDLSSITPDALSGAISQLTRNPQLLSSIASMIGAPAPPNADTAAEASVSTAEKSEAPKDMLATLAPLLSGGIKRSPEEERRDALLCALKPYMSGRRAEMIEYILKYGKFGDILKKLK